MHTTDHILPRFMPNTIEEHSSRHVAIAFESEGGGADSSKES